MIKLMPSAFKKQLEKTGISFFFLSKRKFVRLETNIRQRFSSCGSRPTKKAIRMKIGKRWKVQGRPDKLARERIRSKRGTRGRDKERQEETGRSREIQATSRVAKEYLNVPERPRGKMKRGLKRKVEGEGGGDRKEEENKKKIDKNTWRIELRLIAVQY